ncbi:right-handed parallel beta-helix repeat-containing protein [Planctomycetes bacterium K23_9]|uniref:Right handed beta helix domain-containing protein n=1 Tax=Stieleria marina TaxID=1930275 RepID=A0A517NWP0_9BACT|nr:hypothetical protein K239x_35370 [Planctomycetes bacterium K23_9]
MKSLSITFLVFLGFTIGVSKDAVAQHVFTVNSTGDLGDHDLNDGVAGTGQLLPNGQSEVTLRAAIEQGNFQYQLYLGEEVRIEFDLPGSAPYRIRPQSALPPIFRSEISVHGATQPGFQGVPVVEIDGVDLMLGGMDGLVLSRGEIHDLAVYRFSGSGIVISYGSSAKVRGCYVGVNGAFDAGIGNGEHGIHVRHAGTSNRIERCVVGQNAGDGIACDLDYDFASRTLTVYGNTIGTDPANNLDLGNAGTGIHLRGICRQTNCVFNLVCNNGGDGIRVAQDGFRFAPRETVIRDNIIGLDGLGLTKMPNTGHGIHLQNTSGVEVEACKIGGNEGAGIYVTGSESRFTYVFENSIGSHYDPELGVMLDLGNGGDGVLIDEAFSAVTSTVAEVGQSLVPEGQGYRAVFGNEICGNAGDGVRVTGGLPGGVAIRGNDIGFSGVPDKAAGNRGTGIFLTDQCVGATIQGNWVCNSQESGLKIYGADNLVESNLIGVARNRLGNLVIQGNRDYGVHLTGRYNDVGGPADGLGNFITGNRQGVVISGAAARQNLLSHNRIGVDEAGDLLTPRQVYGVLITGDATLNRVLSSTIRGQIGPGIAVRGDASKRNSVFRSNVAGNGGLDIDLGAAGVNANDVGDGDTGANELQNSPEITEVMGLGNGDLEVSYCVDADPTAVAYPIWVEVYFDDGSEKRYVKRAVFLESDFTAGEASTTIFNGVARLGESVVVATATDADRNTSEFSIGN